MSLISLVSLSSIFSVFVTSEMAKAACTLMCLDACRTLIQLTCLIVSKAISISSLRGLIFTWFFLE